MLDPTQRPPSRAAARARRTRARRREGMACFRVEVNEARVIEALLAAGRLTEAAALERPAVERELAKLLDDWARRWLANLKQGELPPARR